MKRITCKECLFWDTDKDAETGQCRVKSPEGSNYWPTTSANKWCGKGKPLKTYNEMETKDAGREA